MENKLSKLQFENKEKSFARNSTFYLSPVEKLGAGYNIAVETIEKSRNIEPPKMAIPENAGIEANPFSPPK